MDVEAGWFPDPSEAHRLRYWDGTNWSADVKDTAAGKDPLPESALLPPPCPTESHNRHWFSLGLVSVAVLGIVVLFVGVGVVLQRNYDQFDWNVRHQGSVLPWVVVACLGIAITGAALIVSAIGKRR